MTDINFEAIGRCQHLKTLFTELKGKRARVLNEVKDCCPEPVSSLPDTVQYFDCARLRSVCERLDAINIEFMATVEEHNQWAKEANQSLIQITRPYHIPS